MHPSHAQFVPPTDTHCTLAAARLAGYQKARRAWPDIDLPFHQFVAHLERLGWSQSLPAHSEAVYLAAACGLGVEVACVSLERFYFPALASGLAQDRAASDFIEEVLQQTLERLLVGPRPRIETYRGEGPLPAWLMVVTRRVAHDLRRTDRKHRRLLHVVSKCPPSGGGDVEMSGESGAARPLDTTWIERMQGVVRLAIESLAGEDRRLLYLHYGEHVNAAQIGHALGMDRSTVYRRLRRSEHELARFVRRSLQMSLGDVSLDVLEELLRVSYEAVSLDAQLSPAPEQPTRLRSTKTEGRGAHRAQDTAAFPATPLLHPHGQRKALWPRPAVRPENHEQF